MMQGLLCSIYKTERLGDCTNHGESSRANTALILADAALGIPALFDAKPGDVVFRIEKGPGAHMKGYEGQLVAHPVDGCADNHVGWMFGGNFVFTSDSRFPSRSPIAIHDRQEEASMGHVAEGVALRDVLIADGVIFEDGDEIPTDIDADYEAMVADRPFDLEAIRRAHRPPATENEIRQGEPDAEPNLDAEVSS